MRLCRDVGKHWLLSPQYLDCWPLSRCTCQWFFRCISCGLLHCILDKINNQILCLLWEIQSSKRGSKMQMAVHKTLTSTLVALLVEPPVWDKQNIQYSNIQVLHNYIKKLLMQLIQQWLISYQYLWKIFHIIAHEIKNMCIKMHRW